MENSRTCDISNINAHRTSFVRHLRKKRQLESENQNEIIIPEWSLKKSKHILKKN